MRKKNERTASKYMLYVTQRIKNKLDNQMHRIIKICF